MNEKILTPVPNRYAGGDIHHTRLTLHIRKAKGNKDHIVPIGERAMHWLKRYLEEVRPRLELQADVQTVFLTGYGDGFHPNALGCLIRKYIRAADIAKGGAHLLRHTCAAQLLDGGADMEAPPTNRPPIMGTPFMNFPPIPTVFAIPVTIFPPFDAAIPVDFRTRFFPVLLNHLSTHLGPSFTCALKPHVNPRGLPPFIQHFAALRKQVGDDGTHFPDCEKVVQEFWDYDESDHAKAVQISHQFKSTRESKKQ